MFYSLFPSTRLKPDSINKPQAKSPVSRPGCRIAAASAAILFSILLAPAMSLAQQSLYWDSNGNTAGAGTTPSGIWGTDAFWSTDSTGSLATTNPTTTLLDTLYFSAGTDATGTWTLTVNGNQNAKQLNVQEGTVTLSGGNIYLGTGGGINVSGGASLDNTGLIETVGTVSLGGLGSLVNSGTIRNNGGTMSLNVSNSGAIENAGAGTLTLASSLTGGTLSNSSTGIIQSNAFGNYLISSAITNNAGGQITFLGGTTGQTMLRLGTATHTNNGTITFSGLGGAEKQFLTGDVTFNGTGSLVMNTAGDFRGTVGTELLTNGVGHTIQGRGNLGASTLSITNHGTVLATSANPLNIVTNGSGMINSSTGVMRANAGAVLNWSGGTLTNTGLVESLGTVSLGTVDNTGGIIRNNGALMSLGSVTGGAIENLGAGTLTVGGTYSGGTITNSATGTVKSNFNANPLITSTIFNPLGGQITFNGGTTGQTSLRLGAATHTNNGAIEVKGAGGAEQVFFNGDVTFNGSGSLTLRTGGNYRGLTGTERLTIGAGQTLDGYGSLGFNSLAFTNDGTIATRISHLTIDSNAAGITNSATGTVKSTTGLIMTIQGSSLTNTGLVESQGTMNLNSSSIANTGGTVRANGGVINVTGSSVTGGLVEVTGGGTFNSNTSNSGVDNVSLIGGTIAGTTGTLSSAAFDVRSGLISGKIGGAGALTKSTAGIVNITSANSYSGDTFVNEGTLLVNNTSGSATGSGNVSVDNGAFLGGNGIVAGLTTVMSGGTLAPGSSAGALAFTNGLVFEAGSAFDWELTGNTESGRGVNFDAVNVSGGDLFLDANVTSNLIFNGAGSNVDWADSFWDTDHQWLVFDNANQPSFGSEIAIFESVNVSTDSLSNTLSVGQFTWSQNGNDLYLNFSAVPEPSALVLLGLGAIGVMGCRRRR